MDIEYELKTGQLAYFLPRPVSYLGSKLVEGLAALLLNMLVLGTVAFAFSYFWTGELPFTPASFSIAIFLGVLGGFVSLGLDGVGILLSSSMKSNPGAGSGKNFFLSLAA